MTASTSFAFVSRNLGEILVVLVRKIETDFLGELLEFF